MKNDLWRKITLYNYRHLVGFGVLGILTVILAVYRFWDMPNGLSAGEITAATVSGHFSLSDFFSSFPDHISCLIGLPWVLVQTIYIKIFGFSTFAFRLPAVILMILSVAGLVTIACRLFKKNIAIVSGFLIVPSVLLLSLTRNGDGSAMTVFLMVAALFAAVFAVQCKSNIRKSFAKIGVCAALSALIYQPGGLYILATLVIVGFLHPKTRLTIMSSKLTNLIIAAVVGTILLSPLIAGLFFDASTVVGGLLFDGHWAVGNFAELGIALSGVKTGFAGGMITPIVSAVFLIIAIIGIVRSIQHFLSARSHLTLSLLILTAALAVLQPAWTFMLFVPLCLFAVIGIYTLIDEWNGLFPKNPYPHVLASVLIIIMVFLNGYATVRHYVATNIHDAAAIYNYDQEFDAARSVVGEYKNGATLVVPAKRKDFYLNLTHDFPKIKVSEKVAASGVNIVLNSAKTDSKIPEKAIPIKIVTNSHAKDAVLLRVYK
ncbi:glycosyltransferase family 39 protein [Candidatus Saccharibacteria bacterium]|nr:glycosyltransferase family 39 protein [Candidatus Saccharibacteria bacterium]MCL1962812.1 glycosyltransferase family 39 protein [Candidatus Saccharibacteria bacterium]